MLADIRCEGITEQKTHAASPNSRRCGTHLATQLRFVTPFRASRRRHAVESSLLDALPYPGRSQHHSDKSATLGASAWQRRLLGIWTRLLGVG
jgi:hypothetical protein